MVDKTIYTHVFKGSTLLSKILGFWLSNRTSFSRNGKFKMEEESLALCKGNISWKFLTSMSDKILNNGTRCKISSKYSFRAVLAQYVEDFNMLLVEAQDITCTWSAKFNDYPKKFFSEAKEKVNFNLEIFRKIHFRFADHFKNYKYTKSLPVEGELQIPACLQFFYFLKNKISPFCNKYKKTAFRKRCALLRHDWICSLQQHASGQGNLWQLLIWKSNIPWR